MQKIFISALIFLNVTSYAFDLSFSSDFILGPKMELTNNSHTIFFSPHIFYSNSKPEHIISEIENYQKTYEYGFEVAYAKNFQSFAYKNVFVNFIPYIEYGYYFIKERKFFRSKSTTTIQIQPISFVNTIKYNYQKYSENFGRIGTQIEISLKHKISLYMVLFDYGIESKKNKYGEKVIYSFEKPVTAGKFLNLGIRVKICEF